MRIRKAVITAAGQSQRALPLQTLIDRDGQEKPVICILIEQALAADVEEICVVVWPGDEARYAQAAGRHAASVRFVAQPEPNGYGHAILCAREFTGGDPFLHMVGDHLYVTTGETPSAQRLVELAESEECSVSGVQPTRESLLAALRNGRRPPGCRTQRPLPRGYRDREADPHRGRAAPDGARHSRRLLSLLLRHPRADAGVMDLLANGASTLSAALAELARQEQYLALEDEGRRYDLGAPYGLLIAQLALALNGQDRAQVLSQMVELLADRELRAAAGGPRQ